MLSSCDRSRDIDSGLNIFFTRDSCDTMVCLGSRLSLSSNCAIDQSDISLTFRTAFGEVYYIEMFSFANISGFDQNEAGTRGFLRTQAAKFN